MLWLNIGFSLHSGLRLLSHARVACQINRFIANIGTVTSPNNVGALTAANKLAEADLNGIYPCLVSHSSYLFLSACVSLCVCIRAANNQARHFIDNFCFRCPGMYLNCRQFRQVHVPVLQAPFNNYAPIGATVSVSCSDSKKSVSCSDSSSFPILTDGSCRGVREMC